METMFIFSCPVRVDVWLSIGLGLTRCNPVHTALTCVLVDPITSGQLSSHLVHQFTPGVRMRLQWPLVIGSHLSALHANKHVHHIRLKTKYIVVEEEIKTIQSLFLLLHLFSFIKKKKW